MLTFEKCSAILSIEKLYTNYFNVYNYISYETPAVQEINYVERGRYAA